MSPISTTANLEITISSREGLAESVYRELRAAICEGRIPAGERRSYTEVAVALGRPRAVRAVASACAANRLALLIPCHRVLRGDGNLGGFKWGLARKQALLASEQAQLSRLTPAGS